MTGTKETHRKRRQALRRKLKAQGVPADKIERIIARKAAEQRARRQRDGQADRQQRSTEAAAVREQWERETYARLSPDDRGYQPSRPDSVTTGQGRVAGLAARAAKRGKTLTRWEYDEAMSRAEA